MLSTIMRPMLAVMDGILGILVVSNVWKTPHYKVMLAWDPEAMPAD
jgi:hypothetical protein